MLTTRRNRPVYKRRSALIPSHWLQTNHSAWCTALLNRKVDVTVGALSNVAYPADSLSQRFFLFDSSRSIDAWGKTRELLSGEPPNEKVALPLREPVSRINHQPGGRD